MGGGLLGVRDTKGKDGVSAFEEFSLMREMNMRSCNYECNVINATMPVCGRDVSEIKCSAFF